jgi:DNA repair photolyase
MIELFSDDKVLMECLGVKITQPDIFHEKKVEKTRSNKDSGQRHFCDCIISKDIGKYNTCPHLCEYCYANTSKEIAQKNWEIRQQGKNNETI